MMTTPAFCYAGWLGRSAYPGLSGVPCLVCPFPDTSPPSLVRVHVVAATALSFYPTPLKVFGSKEEKYPCGKSPGKIRHQPRGSTRGVGGVSQGRGGRSKHLANSADSKDLRYQVCTICGSGYCGG